MRELKFRAWDIEDKRMLWGIEQEYDGQIRLNCFGDYIELSQPDELKYEIMQYTGLKDKNGKEIYEGDIISFGSFLEMKVVEWEEIWDDKDNLFGYGYGCLMGEGEVIGNIYQHPHFMLRFKLKIGK